MIIYDYNMNEKQNTVYRCFDKISIYENGMINCSGPVDAKTIYATENNSITVIDKIRSENGLPYYTLIKNWKQQIELSRKLGKNAFEITMNLIADAIEDII